MFLKHIQKIKKNKIFSNSLIYLFFSITTQIIGLLYTPILTRNLSIENYGSYNLVLSIQGILSIVFTLCISSGFSRFYNEIKNKTRFVNSIINVHFILGFSSLIVINLFKNSFSKLLFGNLEHGSKYMILLSVLSILVGIISIYETVYSMEYKAKQAALINFIRIVSRLVIVYFLSIKGKLEIESLLKIQISINFMIFIYLFLKNKKIYKLEFDFKLSKPAIKFGIGLIFGTVSTWILGLIDRRFLSEYSGLKEVGIYSLSYTIGMLINPVFLMPFRKIFTPFKFKVYNEKNGKEKILNFYEIYNFIGILCVLGLSLYSKIFISILATEEYYSAARIIPLIAISYFFWGLNEFYGLGLNIKNKTFTNSVIAAMAAGINIVLNILLIPKYGIYGAAVATIISYFITDIIYYISLKKHFKIGIKFYSWVKFLIVYIIIYGLYLNLNFSLIIEFFVNILLVLLYIGICYKLRFIRLENFKKVKV